MAAARPGPEDDDYAAFLARKQPAAPAAGLDVVPALHPALKPFQADIVGWALRRGRAAIFAGTGLGKTLQQLVWADAVRRATRGEILILTPLAVAEQTVREAAKFHIPGVAYAADGRSIAAPIAVSNYERLEKFDPARFAGVVLDESSILKAHDGATRQALLEAFARTPWRLACTATPAPNDYVELGNHAEFLGVMSQKEMLAMFFVHDGSIRASGGAEWRLKRHAEAEFWRWVASWAVMIRHPRDLGHDEPGYDLPPLERHEILVPAPPVAGALLPPIASTLQERIAARRETVAERVAAAARIAAGRPDEPWLIWCGLNEEAERLARAIPGAVNVQGSDHPDVKKRHLLGFVDGRPRVLITKPSIAGWGMNFQHCRSMIFVGLNDSFEQMFQAIRRCWRFGQARPVDIWIVASEREGAVVANVERKEREFERMADAMMPLMAELARRTVKGGRVATSDYRPAQRMALPGWLAS